MSTKTTFKRVALVAVAALGLGVLSVAPSSAGVSGLSVTVASSTTTVSGKSDSSTAATITVDGLLDRVGDTVTVTFVEKSRPAASTAAGSVALLQVWETSTPKSGTRIGNDGTFTDVAFTAADSNTAGTAFAITHATTGFVGAKFFLMLESQTATYAAGDYVYTAIVKSYSADHSTVTTTKDLTISIAKATTLATTVSTTNSFARLNKTSGVTTSGADDLITAASTAGATVGYVYVGVRNAANGTAAAEDSITATITGAGILSQGGITGTSFKVATVGDKEFTVLSDGRAGVATISIATNGVVYSAKTLTFYAKSAKSFSVPSVARPVIGTLEVSDVVRATALDANGVAWTGDAYIVASSAADALIAGSTTPVKCTFDVADNRHECPVTGTAIGTAKFKLIDASTVALATATSDEVSVRVSVASPATISMAWDKATYLPGEKASLRVTVLDAAGLALPTGAITNLFASGAITSNLVLTAVNANATNNSVSPTVAGANSSSNPNDLATAGTVTYMYTMPQTTGTVTATAKGGTALPLAGQVTVTASAEVTNPSNDAATDAANEATDAANAATDAALAAADAADAATAAAQDASDAVAALSATVAKLVASLKAQITSLTNLVIKIQKKVRA